MEYSASYATAARDQAKALFGLVMLLVASAAGLFALGCFAGRDMSAGWSIAWFAAGFAALISMHFTVRRSEAASLALLMCVGLFLGMGMGPALAYYSATSPQAVWQAAGATALLLCGTGAFGYGTRRDLGPIGRISFFALFALLIFGVFLVFIRVPGGDLIYSVLGLAVFAGLTMYDFQRLRRSGGLASAPLIAASIFLDALNAFLFFVRLFGSRD